MTRPALVLAALLGAGCSCSDPVAICGTTDRGFDRFAVVGEPSLVTVGLTHVCNLASRGVGAADEVTVELFDPDGAPYPHTSTGSFTRYDDFQSGNLAAVSFTPDRPGTWFIKANFEPALGRSQQFVEVAEAMPDAGVHVVSLGATLSCDAWELTARGTLLCVTPGQLQTSRGQQLAGSAFAFDGDFVWRLGADVGDSGVLQRYVDDGSSLSVTHTRAGLSSADGMLLARDGEAWLLTDPTVGALKLRHAVVEPDGGLAIDSLNVPARGPNEGVGAIALVATDAGAVAFFHDSCVECTGDCRACGADQVVALGSDGGPSTSVPQQTQFLGGDGQTLWFSSGNPAFLTALRLTEKALVRGSVALPLGTNFPFKIPNPREGKVSAPIVPITSITTPDAPFDPRVVVPRFEGETIGLQTLPRDVVFATRRHAFAVSADGKTVTVYDRP